MFWCICAYFQITKNFFRKRYFWTFWTPDFQKYLFWKKVSGGLEVYFQTSRIMSLKKIFFNIWSGKKRVLMHLRILPDHQKLFFKKDIFKRLEWLKTCFDAFAHTSRPPETFFQKRYFWKSAVVKNAFWCIFAYFQTTRKMFLKNIFLTVWSG